MSDNSPDWDRLIEHYSEVEEFGTEPQRAELLDALRAAAALAREVAELRSENLALQGESEIRLNRAESAESANRALQAEVDRLRRELHGIGRAALAWSEPHPNSEGHMP